MNPCILDVIITSYTRGGIVNKKGQALVEFVIILPIFILMLLGIIDIGKIIYYQNNLENKMEDVVTLYQEKKSYDEIKEFLEKNTKNVRLEITNEDNKYVELKVEKKTDIITPGLNLVLKNPYWVSVKRVIYYENE